MCFKYVFSSLFQTKQGLVSQEVLSGENGGCDPLEFRSIGSKAPSGTLQ